MSFNLAVNDDESNKKTGAAGGFVNSGLTDNICW